ncbi:MAG: terpene cyclase/mutase family protein [Candidatus Brocadiae bacterium]|nr:terpene cyclase/mutase family protein [Candidatus Brocadiia bacterium]
MRPLLLSALCLAVLSFGPRANGPTAEAQKERGPSADLDLPPEAQQAVEAGISFLIRTQNPDGSWLSDGSTGRYPTAITALAGLALLANGSTCYSGKHTTNVRAAVEYILQHADADTGLIGGQEAGRPMFGHGFAMLFLAQVYGSEGEPALQRRIRAALVNAVTITQMQGLRACANAGIAVPSGTVKRALGYIRQSANPDGGIAYRAGVAGPSRSGITCAAVATMYAAGLYEDELVENAFRYATENVSVVAPSRAGGTHFFYSHLYLSQVVYFRGGRQWEEYFRGIRNWLLEAQNEDGSWSGDYIGRAYGAACALLILQLPYNNLPVLQR